MREYDALLFVSFGGPERPEDVMPFLENVTRGRNVPRERLLGVAEHYHHFGGKSPINDQNRALIAALERDFQEHDIQLPIYFGNRNWAPYLQDAVAAMTALVRAVWPLVAGETAGTQGVSGTESPEPLESEDATGTDEVSPPPG